MIFKNALKQFTLVGFFERERKKIRIVPVVNKQLKDKKKKSEKKKEKEKELLNKVGQDQHFHLFAVNGVREKTFFQSVSTQSRQLQLLLHLSRLTSFFRFIFIRVRKTVCATRFECVLSSSFGEKKIRNGIFFFSPLIFNFIPFSGQKTCLQQRKRKSLNSSREIRRLQFGRIFLVKEVIKGEKN